MNILLDLSAIHFSPLDSKLSEAGFLLALIHYEPSLSITSSGVTIVLHLLEHPCSLCWAHPNAWALPNTVVTAVRLWVCLSARLLFVPCDGDMSYVSFSHRGVYLPRSLDPDSFHGLYLDSFLGFFQSSHHFFLLYLALYPSCCFSP